MKIGLNLCLRPCATTESSGYGTQAQAVIDEIELQGGAPTDEEKDAIDQFFTDIGVGGLALLKRLFVPVWADANANAVDWVSPGTNSGTWNGGVTHAAGYAQSNGTTGYLDFNVSPAGAGLALDDGCIFYYSGSNSGSNSAVDMGAIGPGVNSERFGVYCWDTSTAYFDYSNNSGGRISGSNSNRSGLFMGNRLGTSRRLVRKTSAGTTVIASATSADSGTIPSVNLYGMRFNYTTPNYASREHGMFGLALGHSVAEESRLLDSSYTMLDSFTTHKPTMI